MLKFSFCPKARIIVWENLQLTILDGRNVIIICQNGGKSNIALPPTNRNQKLFSYATL